MSFNGRAKSDDLFSHIKLLTSDEIESLISMSDAIEVMKRAFSSFSSGKSQVPQRYVSTFEGTNMDLFLKPAYSKDLGKVAIKILTQNQGIGQKNLANILGVVLLVDIKTGAFLAMMDGACITALRTGAASGIATKYLAAESAETLAIFGCGVQAKTQFEAINCVRPLKRVLLYDINVKNAIALKSYILEKEKILVQVEDNLVNLKNAEIICTATIAESPLFGLNDISKGVHINAIGSYKPNMQEIDPQILKEGMLFVDSRDAVLQESGDLIKPINYKLFSKDVIKAEIGELFLNKVKGRHTSEEISIFKSVGLGVQDLYVADKIYSVIQSQGNPTRSI